MILSNAAIKNRTTVGVMVVLIVAAGTFSYVTLPRESMPDVEMPIIIITTPYEGVSPEDIETSVTMKIETKLSGMKGVKEITSSSAEGMSTITVEFMPDVKIDDAMQYVRDKVDLARGELDPAVEDPVITEMNVAEIPIIVVSVTGPVSVVRLKAIADRLEEEIEQNVPGVLNVDVLGGREREIRLEVDQDLVASYGLRIPELISLIPSEHVNISAGALDMPGMTFNVRVPAEISQPEEVDQFPLTARGNKPIYLYDVAKVIDTFKDRTGYSRLNGDQSVTISIQKRIGADILPLADGVRKVLDEARLRVPQGVDFTITTDQSRDIRMMVKDLENNLLSGLVLVVIVLVLFMGFRSSLIVALAIPLSMLISFTLIQAVGLTLNMMVLFSLIMSLGMLVDNAIVIVENIYRFREMGHDRVHAAMKGTAEVAWPVIASTATTIAAFAPLLFWPGVMGDFMKYLPMTLIITLSSSLFVAMIINPVVSSLVAGGGKGGKGKKGKKGESAKDKTDSRFVRAYRSLLAVALNNRAVTLTLSLLLLVAMGFVYSKLNRGVELFPEIDPRFGVVNIRAAQGTSIHHVNDIARIVEEHVETVRPDLKHVVTNVGASGSGNDLFGGGSSGPHVANLMLTFLDYEDRKRSSAEALDELRPLLKDITGFEVKVEKPQEGPPTGAPIAVRIIGEDFRTLQEISERIKKIVAKVPGVINLRSDFEGGRPELAFHVDRRRAMMLGVNAAIVGNFLKTAIFGREVGIYRQFNEEYDITIRLPLEQRVNLDDIGRIRVPTDSGKAVPLSSLGEFSYDGGYGTIRRINQKRAITISGDNAEGTQEDKVLKDVKAKLADLKLPDDYSIKYAGQQEEQEKAIAFLSKAYVVAILLIVMILVAQFNTLSVPLIIMTTVVLSLIGVLGGLLICNMPFGIIMTGVGVISLAGVVVNNAIVLLDYTRQLQHKGMDAMTAAINAGTTRLRPVLLTATTTILGLIPMATGVSFNFHAFSMVWKSESSEWWSSMAVAVIFGLAFATVLTLIVVPTLYVALYKMAKWFGMGGLTKPDDEEYEQPIAQTDEPTTA